MNRMKNESNYPIYLWPITIVASCGGLLFGFDMAVISGVLPLVKSQFGLSAVEEGWFVSSALIGCILGVSFSGEMSDRFGRKLLLLTSAVLFLLAAIACALARDFALLVLARVCAGVGVGVASIVVPLYLSEIAPPLIRGRLVTCYQLAITIGIVVAYLTNSLLLNFAANSHLYPATGIFTWLFVGEVWRGMFAIGIIPALFFFFGLLFVPESPKWLTSKELVKKANQTLNKPAGSAIENFDQVKPLQEAYQELFSPRRRKALLLGILLPLFSQFSGINAIVYYGPSIMHNAGLSLKDSLWGQILFGLANLVFTFIAMWKVDDLGRRPLYLIGTLAASVSLFFTGIFFLLGNTGSPWLLFFVVVFLASFAFSIGPLKFVVISEIYPTRIRGRAMAVSIMVMWVADALMGQLTPVMLSKIGTAGTFWVFSLFCFIAFLTIYKLLPETKGQTLEQIERGLEGEGA